MIATAVEAAREALPPATWLAGALFVLGLVGVVIPVLPGLLLCVAAVLVWAVAVGGPAAWTAVALVLALYLAGAVLQWVLPGRRMTRQGVGGASVVLGLLAGVAGFFLVPVVGGPLFFVAAIYLLERLRHREHARAASATRAAVIGVLHSIGVELAAALLMACVWLGAIVVVAQT